MMPLAAHLPILPVLLPLMAGALLLAIPRVSPSMQRFIGLMGVAGLLVSTFLLGIAVAGGQPWVYQVGNWPSWAGITFLVDGLAVLMLALTALLGLAALLYASGGEDRCGAHFHAIFQFQLMGLAGAFLTHDLFNLFVFFEVLLIASYGLMLHGGGGERLRRGMHYVVVNLVASALFLVAIGVFYGVLGTLNLADLSQRIAEADPSIRGLLHAGGGILLLVFAIKSAVLPLHFWLPKAYAASPVASTIVFAVMTKLGLYAVLRVFTLLFGPAAGSSSGIFLPLLFWAGAATVIAAGLGALASTRLRGLIGYLVVGSAGVLFLAVGQGGASALAGGLFYLVNATLAAAVFFVLADWIRRSRVDGDSLERPSAMASRGRLGVVFLIVAVACIGLPPLAGFLGKLLILDAVAPEGDGASMWAVILLAGWLNLVALARAASRLFWQAPPIGQVPPVVPVPAVGERLSLALLLSALLAITVLASDLLHWSRLSAASLLRVEAVRHAVLEMAPLPTTVPR